MYVQADWLSNTNTEDDVVGTMSAAWAVKSTFQSALQKRLQGQTIQFGQGDDLLIIGGRSSIQDAFAANPVQNWNFVPARGEILSVTARRKTHTKGKMLSMLPGLGLKMATNESARSAQVRDKVGKILDVSTKKYTLVHIVSGHAGPDDYQLPNSTSGAQMALLLRHYFESYM